MNEKELLKERFKSAVSSAVKAISENPDVFDSDFEDKLEKTYLKNWFYFSFLNTKLDLRTHQFSPIKSDDYIFMTTGYNWDFEKYSGGRNFGHLAYSVKNIYETCDKLMKEGVIINRPPRDGHMAFIKSPDGISIEILQEGESLELEEPWKSMENIGTW